MAAPGSDGVAFFQFGTNAGETAAQIVSAMAAIQGAVNRPLSKTEMLALDTGGLGTMFSRVESEIDKGRQRIQGLVSDLGMGRINPKQMQDAYRRIVRETLTAMPMGVADTLSMVNPDALRRMPMTRAMRQWGIDAVTELDRTLQTEGRKIKGFSYDPKPATFMKDIEAIAANPIGAARTGYGAVYRANFVEQLVKQFPSAKDGGEDLIRNLGLADEVAALRKPATAGGIVRYDDNNKPVGIIDTGVASRLKNLDAERRSAMSAAYAEKREFDDATKARDTLARTINEQAAAQRLLNGLESQKSGQPAAQGLAAAQTTGKLWETTRGRIVEEMGLLTRVHKPTPDGFTEDLDPKSRRAAIEDMNRQKLALQDLTEQTRNYQSVLREGRALGNSANPTTYLTGWGNDRRAWERVRTMEGGTGFVEIQDDLRKRAVLAAEDRQLQAAASAAQAQRERDEARRLRDLQKDSGLLGGAMGRLHRNELSPLSNMGSQIMSAGIFSAAYGSIFASIAAVGDTVREFMDYQDSLTDLEVATRSADMVTGAWINTLSELSRLSGSNVGTALDTAARGVRAFGDVAGSTKSEIEAIGTATAEAATQIALIANKDMKDATGDAIAIGTAFEMEPDQLSQVVDAIANAKRGLGGDPAQIAQGLSLIAGSAREAGFDLNEAASLISLVQARTDQSGQAIATRWSRVFQIMSGSTGKALGRELGVDTNQSVKDQILDLAAIYQTTDSEAVKDRITSAMGGTANLREILPILRESDRFLEAYGESMANAGQGTNEFERKSDNMVGTLKKISGTIRNIQVDLARADLFAPIGAGVKVLEPALHGLDRLLRMFGELPDWATVPAAAGVDAMLLAKGVGMVQARGGLFRKGVEVADDVVDEGLEHVDDAARVAAEKAQVGAITAATGERTAVEARQNAAITAATGQRVAAERAAAGAAVTGAAKTGGTMRSGFAAIGRALLNPWVAGITAAVGGLWAFNRVMEQIEQREGFLKENLDSFSAFGRLDGTEQSLKLAAQDLRSSAGTLKQKDATGWESTQFRDQTAKGMISRAEGLEYLAKIAAEEEALAAASRNLTVFGDGAVDTVQELGNGMTALSAAGETALTSMRALYKVLDSPDRPDTAVRFSPAETVTKIIGAMFSDDVLRGAIPDGTKATYKEDVLRGYKGAPVELGVIPDTYEDMLGPVDVESAVTRIPTGEKALKRANEAIRDMAEKMGLEPGDKISQAQIRLLVDAAIDSADLSELPEHADRIRQLWYREAIASLEDKPQSDQEKWTNFFMENLPTASDLRQDRQNMLNGKGALTEDQALSLLNPSEDGTWEGLLAINANALDAIPPGDDGSQKEQVLRTQIRKLRSIQQRVAKAGGDIPQLNLELDRLEYDLAESAIERLDRLRRSAQNRATSKKEIRNIGVESLTQQILAADGFTDLLIAIMDEADKKSLDIVEASLKRAAELAKKARLAMQQVAAISSMGLSMLGELPKTDAELDYEAFLKARNQSAPAPKDSKYSTGSDANLPEKLKEEEAEDDHTAWQHRALRAQALIDPDNTVAAAAAAVEVARANRDAAKTVDERTAALQELAAAEDSYDKALATHAGLVAQVQGARTNSPIDQAKGQIAAAAAQMRASAKGTDGYLQALISFYQGQWAMREAVLAYRNNLALLRGDMTDPVEQARDALRAAERKLRMDRRNGAGKDVIAADKVAKEQSEATLEKARWDQKLSDMKIAEQLGRISHAQYISYLERESRRMHRMNNKTRQQIDYMNQVDLELKSANDAMDAMWNLGDINTRGLVYQMRRFREERKAEAKERSAASAIRDGAGASSQTVTINIDGADVAKVRRIVEDVVGKPTRVITSSPRRR